MGERRWSQVYRGEGSQAADCHHWRGHQLQVSCGGNQTCMADGRAAGSRCPARKPSHLSGHTVGNLGWSARTLCSGRRSESTDERHPRCTWDRDTDRPSEALSQSKMWLLGSVERCPMCVRSCHLSPSTAGRWDHGLEPAALCERSLTPGHSAGRGASKTSEAGASGHWAQASWSQPT